jgi:diguanylate cyclase (GGDEF)-like protein
LGESNGNSGAKKVWVLKQLTLKPGVKTLRSKVQILFAVLIGLMGLLVVASFMLLANQQVDTRIKFDSEALTRLLATQIAEDRESLLTKSRLIARVPTVRTSTTRMSDLQDLANEFRTELDADALAFLDENGELAIKSGTFPNPARSKDLREALQKGEREWSGVVSSEGRLFLVAITPVAGHGRISSVITLKSVGKGLATKLRDGANADVAFMSGSIVVASSMQIDVPIAQISGAWTTMSIKGREFVVRYTEFPGTRVEQGIGFVALRELDIIEAPYRALGVAFITALLIALGVAMGLTNAFARSLTRPLEATVQAAQQVRDGAWPEPLVVNTHDEIGLLQSVFNDMTASLRSSQERLMNMIDVDPLTELENHRRFKERLDQEVFRAMLDTEALAVCLVDIDGFADYNSKHGHAAGDEALKRIAGLLREVFPGNSFFGRYGGEEFAILMPGAPAEIAEAASNRLRAIIGSKLNASITISVGVAELDTGITTGAGLLLSAELALGRAKQLGKDQVCKFESVPGASETEDPFQLQKFLEDTTFATIQALAGAVDAKDPYTQGHSLRVAKYASDLAKYTGASAQEVDMIYRCGTLHDVGKIGVPDAILKKPARLDDEEQRVMETHPALGEIIVRRAPQLEDMLPGVRHHHERWDGRGYPDGLMADAIPRLARFIAIADTFDAMTSDRPYRKALTVQQALDEIQRGAGTQFEPSLALAFVRMMTLHGQVGQQRAA